MYSLLRPFLFQLNAETSHNLTLAALNRLNALGLLHTLPVPESPRTVMGITFPNPVGLAAGLDKNGDYIRALAQLGFGFLEIGTVTPRPQPGNPKPRLFRLPKAQAIINRMGFNNHGVEALIHNVEYYAKFKGVLGINIGKNFDTPVENAHEDYLHCLRRVYASASYVTVNISSPNTKNLRQLQERDALEKLLSLLKEEQDKLASQHGKYTPIALKIAPDLSGEQIADIADLLLKHKFDGVIATNTTIDHHAVAHLPHGNETGGLSGAPVRAASTTVIRQLAQHLQGRLPIIGVGGILSGADAAEKMHAGASLVQIYTGLIYRGPGLVREVADALQNLK